VANLTITPKERLSPVDKNVLLSSILKFFFPGNWRMIRSTHIIDAVHKSVQLSMKFFNPGIEAVSRGKKAYLQKYRLIYALVQISTFEVHASSLPMPLTAVMIHPRVSLSSTMLLPFL
jgi:hypothetical protein